MVGNNLNANLSKSTNGGLNWFSQTSNSTEGLLKLNFVDANTGFAVGYSGAMIKTTTGGTVTKILNIGEQIPNKYSLSQNYPNPFNPKTKIRFDLPKNSFTKLTIHDITGKVIDELFNSELQSGAYEIIWDGINHSSGVYFYRIETSGFVDMKRMVLVK